MGGRQGARHRSSPLDRWPPPVDGSPIQHRSPGLDRRRRARARNTLRGRQAARHPSLPRPQRNRLDASPMGGRQAARHGSCPPRRRNRDQNPMGERQRAPLSGPRHRCAFRDWFALPRLAARSAPAPTPPVRPRPRRGKTTDRISHSRRLNIAGFDLAYAKINEECVSRQQPVYKRDDPFEWTP